MLSIAFQTTLSKVARAIYPWRVKNGGWRFHGFAVQLFQNLYFSHQTRMGTWKLCAVQIGVILIWSLSYLNVKKGGHHGILYTPRNDYECFVTMLPVSSCCLSLYENMIHSDHWSSLYKSLSPYWPYYMKPSYQSPCAITLWFKRSLALLSRIHSWAAGKVVEGHWTFLSNENQIPWQDYN